MNQFLDAGRRLGVDRIEQTGTLEVARRGLVFERVTEVAVIVLVDLGMDDHSVIDLHCPNERGVSLDSLGRRPVSRVAVIGKPQLIVGEQMQGIDQVSFGAGCQGLGDCGCGQEFAAGTLRQEGKAGRGLTGGMEERVAPDERDQGLSARQVARSLRLARNTVRRFLRAEGFPERQPRRPRPSLLTPYEPYLP